MSSELDLSAEEDRFQDLLSEQHCDASSAGPHSPGRGQLQGCGQTTAQGLPGTVQIGTGENK